MVHRLDHVAFAGPAIGVVAAAVDVEANVIQIFRSGFVAIELVQETHLGQAAVSAVQHDVQPPFLDLLAVIGRQGDGVGLDGAVNLRTITVDDGRTGALVPRCLGGEPLADANQPAFQGFHGPLAIRLLVELVMLGDPGGRFVINLDVGQDGIVNFFAAKQLQRDFEFVLAFLDFIEDVLAGLFWGRRGILRRGRGQQRQHAN